ncbi:hypothetical protein A2533_03415 [Candidatus Falkowbacteria bacterium RIFOXYD2_FULL_35_9]|uniref:GtrA/DPMS transmembrane domain-containing protein n=1 Tax=Candidatus Falkowbacteria bacterium RIFOXYC2_FULL_36_12 TaxID=1798002 RepID=A0A1F5SWB4_9BACT|nr:MAG: hypothetical protein A2478_00595 [Candidatus Falkowbacteria bacterium RIFOXYC2_FULL_36_12]OGF33003.1 MAG: hypothetical protein A2223_02095 [Candidatus Falkowbacteria bacterium RIFOXYA2_FULL_35_8]OGF47050.1 MAG: hypothetical protein A2533_03415 [Candidatus Falkowbacteria bacterium RIFOXYD2_FULL_35_9]
MRYISDKKFICSKQFIKYSIIGIVSSIIDFSFLNIFIFFTDWGVYYSAIGAFLIANFNSFLWNKYWIFGKKQRLKVAKQYGLFLLFSFIGLILNIGIMSILIEWVGLWYNWAKLVAVLIVLLWNYNINKHYTFVGGH